VHRRVELTEIDGYRLVIVRPSRDPLISFKGIALELKNLPEAIRLQVDKWLLSLYPK